MIAKYVAIAIIGVTALWIGKGYSAYADRRIGEMRGISTLILHMEGRLSRTLDYGDRLFVDFSDDFLEKCGFLPQLREGKSLSDAFSVAEETMVLPEKTREGVRDLFSSFGKGYRDREIERLRLGKKKIDEDIAYTVDLLEKNKRVVNALLFGISASGAILLM